MATKSSRPQCLQTCSYGVRLRESYMPTFLAQFSNWKRTSSLQLTSSGTTNTLRRWQTWSGRLPGACREEVATSSNHCGAINRIYSNSRYALPHLCSPVLYIMSVINNNSRSPMNEALHNYFYVTEKDCDLEVLKFLKPKLYSFQEAGNSVLFVTSLWSWTWQYVSHLLITSLGGRVNS